MIELTDLSKRKKTNLPLGTLYEYENGLKILYSKGKNTAVDYVFLGGSSSQKFNGMAHYVEHLMFLSGALDKACFNNNGTTSKFMISYENEFKHENLDGIKDTNYLAMEKSKLRKVIYDHIDVFFDEVDSKGWLDGKSPQFTKNCFEEEKNIIDEECREKYEDKRLRLTRLFDDFCDNRTYLVNCGNGETLKNVTIEDVIAFKENNHVLENFTYIIRSPLAYDEIEEMLVEKLCSRLKSNPKGKVELAKIASKSIDFERYNVYFEPEKKDKKVIEGFTRFVINITEETLKKDLMALYLMRYLLSSNYSYEKLRLQERLVYGISNSYYISDKSLELNRDFSVKKENLAKMLNAEVTCLKNLFGVDFDIEKYYQIKAEMDAQKFDIKDYIQNYARYDYTDYFFFLNLTNKILDECQEEFKKLSYEQMQDLLKNALDKGKFNVILRGNVELSDLPSIDYLTDKLRGREQSRIEYPKNMQEDKNKHKKVVDISKPMTQALMVREESFER